MPAFSLLGIFSKVISMVIFYSKFSSELIFETFYLGPIQKKGSTEVYYVHEFVCFVRANTDHLQFQH